MASNLRVVPQSMPMGSPSQQGWFWNGTNWCWDGDFDPCPPCPPPSAPSFPCPPSGFPTPCPPWFPPPAGQAPWYPGANGGVSFSATPPVNPIRGNFWWDGVMLHLFDGAAWVDIGPGAAGGGSAGGGTFVGTSPPQNPATGTTWWNGTIFQVWDGSAWKLVGPPATTGTTALEFAIQQPAAVTVGVDSSHWTVLPLTATPNVDLQSAWNTTTLRYTPKVAGYYQFQIRGINLGTAAGLAVVKNDPGTYTSLAPDITVCITASAANGWLSASGISQMNGSTDYVRLWGYESTGTFPPAGTNNVLGIFLLP